MYVCHAAISRPGLSFDSVAARTCLGFVMSCRFFVSADCTITFNPFELQRRSSTGLSVAVGDSVLEAAASVGQASTSLAAIEA